LGKITEEKLWGESKQVFTNQTKMCDVEIILPEYMQTQVSQIRTKINPTTKNLGQLKPPQSQCHLITNMKVL